MGSWVVFQDPVASLDPRLAVFELLAEPLHANGFDKHRTDERVRELLMLRELLGVSLEELRELVAAESARASLRQEWHAGIEDPVRRRQVLEESQGHIENQLRLLRSRRKEIDQMVGELETRKRRVRDRLRSLRGQQETGRAGARPRVKAG